MAGRRASQSGISAVAVAIVCGVVWGVGAAVRADEVSSGRDDPAQGDVVYCYDPKLAIVQRKLVGHCTGEVVTAEQAERIRVERIERRRQLLAQPRKPIIAGHRLRGIGTAFFVDRNGMLLTNNHVVDGCAAISVETPDGRSAQARLIDTQPADDLALIQTSLVPTSIATFLAAPDLRPDDPVSVVGYPDQGMAPIKPLTTTGRLGPAGLPPDGRPLFHINADIRHGNSGGPVVDDRALVIGVVFAKIDTVSVYQNTGRKVRFIGAVIDNRAVFDLLERNDVGYRKAPGGPKVDAGRIDAAARAIVVRAGCWE
jgi:S1-C subfamily serine protease